MALGSLVDDAQWAAHEILHFAGLWDLYGWITGEIKKGYADQFGLPANLMAGLGGSWQIDHSQMEKIVRDRLKESQGWVLGVDYEVQP